MQGVLQEVQQLAGLHGLHSKKSSVMLHRLVVAKAMQVHRMMTTICLGRIDCELMSSSRALHAALDTTPWL